MVGRPILTAAAMRSAEEAAVQAGTPVEELMDRAGRGAAEAICRFAGAQTVLVLCGPGNNGGDGYVVARVLREEGFAVRVAALGEPRSPAAQGAREAWAGPVERLEEAAPAPLLIDALFGTGLTRPLDSAISERLCALAAAARLSIAIDLPSGAATDDGRLLSPVPDFDLTISFATHKPSHLLQPAARHIGRLVIADIGIAAESRLRLIDRPKLPAPTAESHKYNRGYVAVIGGGMPGAAALAASAAQRAGAGYVRLVADEPVANVPMAVVQGGTFDIADERIGAVALGPGLGRDREADRKLQTALRCGRPLVLDADALVLLAEDRSALSGCDAILTPHEGEFARLFGTNDGSKVDRALAAAAASNAVVLLKGADTVVASPDGRAAIAAPASPWLASAGTGDVLTGIIAAMRARGLPAFESACAGAWLHAAAAKQAGPWLIADDLVRALPSVLAPCL